MINLTWPYIVLGLLGTYLLKLIAFGEFTNYSNPRYLYFAGATAVLLIVTGVLGIILILRKNNKFSMPRSVDPKLMAILAALVLSALTVYGLLLLIIVLFIPIRQSKLDEALRKNWWLDLFIVAALLVAFGLPPQRLSPLTAHQRYSDINTISSNELVKSAAHKFQVDESKFSIGDWVKSLNVNPDVKYYEGKSVTVDGFLFVPEDFPEDMFMVARFKVSCCAIDATPVGIPVSYAWRPTSLTSNTWVQVKGKFAIRSLNGADQVVIEPDEVNAQQAPRDPYIF